MKLSNVENVLVQLANMFHAEADVVEILALGGVCLASVNEPLDLTSHFLTAFSYRYEE